MIFSTRTVLRQLAIASIFSIALFALGSAARADLNPGGVQFNPVLGLPPAGNYTAGPVPPSYSFLTSTTFPLTYIPANYPADAFNGSVTSSVYKNGLGQLAFSYVFNNLPPVLTADNEITHATIGDPSNPWAGVTIFAAGSDGTGSSHAVGAPGWTNGDPYDISRDFVGTGSGVGVFFNQANSGTELDSMTSDRSAAIWFATDAKLFRESNVGLIDHGVSGTGHAFAPVVPEPSTIVLTLVGALGILVGARRRRQSQLQD